jgi:ribonuclease Z
VGIPDLWLTGFLEMPYGRRNGAFVVRGPKGTAEMMSHLEKAYEADIRIRRDFNPSLAPKQVAIDAADFAEGNVYDENGVRVTAFRVKHADIDAYGFRVDYKGRSVVISGDMSPNENFLRHAKGADVVIHEVGVARPALLEKSPETRRMIASHHSSPEEAGRDFNRIQPKLAVYSHYTRPRGEDIPEVTIAEIISRTRTTYSGPLEAGEDLMSISIGDSVTVKRQSK